MRVLFPRGIYVYEIDFLIYSFTAIAAVLVSVFLAIAFVAMRLLLAVV